MKTMEEPPYLTVGTDVSAKYRGAFCEAKIKTAKRLVKAKVTFKLDSSTAEVHDEHIRGVLKVGAVVEVKSQDGSYQEATINKLTDASSYTVVFDDGDEKTLRRSSLCLKGARHFAESETLDRLPLTNPEHFSTPVIGKKRNRGRRSNPVQEEESSSSSSEEEEADQRLSDELLGKVVCVEGVATAEKRRTTWYPGLVVSPDCIEDVAMKRDSVLVRSFKDGKFCVVLCKDVRELNSESTPKADAGLRPALEAAILFQREGVLPSMWKMEVKDESSSSEEDEGEEEEREEDSSSDEEEEEVEPFPEERENFLQQLYKFMEDRGTPINKRPVLGYRNLNLFKLYRLVHKLGGFDSIDSGAVWKQVYQDLGIPVLNSAAGYNAKCAYRKYLYGFEEYGTSTGITFQMELPSKLEKKADPEANSQVPRPLNPSKECMADPRATDEEQMLSTEKEASDSQPAVSKEAAATQSVLGVEDRPAAANIKTEEVAEKDGSSEAVERTAVPQAENIGLEQEQEKSEDEEGEWEEFVYYPPGMKVQVRYGRGRSLKMYEATVKESDLEGDEMFYLVHYCGWNIRYDEWIKADQIVRPVKKNVRSIRLRRRIKKKSKRERDRLERLDTMGASSPKPSITEGSAKANAALDSLSNLRDSSEKGTNQSVAKSVEMNSDLNGLHVTESSTEESEPEEERDHGNDGLKHDQGVLRKGGPPEDWEGGPPQQGGAEAVLCDSVQNTGGQDNFDTGRCKEGEGVTHKRRSEGSVERPARVQGQSRTRCRTAEWLPGSSPKRPEERNAPTMEEEDLMSSSSSSEDEGENLMKAPADEGNRGRSKARGPPSKKYNGLKEKVKHTRAAGIWEVPEKRTKLAPSADERVAGSRPKGQKDVWSSIQGQWPKKTLKELFSDSDTEAANSPPQALPPPEEPRVEEERPDPEATRASPSSGTNSVLNTPPTTPECPSPGEAADGCCNTMEAPEQTQAESPAQPLLPPLQPPQEENVGGRSETDSSTVEIESLGGEAQELPQEGTGSPSTAFDGSLSCNSSSSSLELSCSSQLEGQREVKGSAAGQKRQRELPSSGSVKRHKRSHKSSSEHHKKSRKPGHSSDSEDQSTTENAAKSSAHKTAGRMHKHGDASHPHQQQHREHHGRSPRIYKWSFQMSDLEKMSSLERIAFLQEKIQEIRNHYLSLKSEVASIDRRRKRLKKKERESAAAASSASSSPSSSSLTAAVILALAESPVAGPTQNSGMSVECR
ncbi:AT-rich interactive domain-containing protein 4B-like isoform X1 [Scleropages formosus]|nr:AT-rich interactive domain-containing protein 4B-like isoform X1 [Scleropages formosus]